MDGNVIIKAVLDTVDVSKNIKALERDLQGISWKNITEGDEKAAKLSSSFKKAGTAATVTLTAPVVAAGKAVFGVASDYEQANARIAAAFGVSGEEAERFSGIGKRIYEGGWGQSLDEVNDALIQCKSTLRDVSDEDLQTVTTSALMLSDTFGADVNESIRGTNALMEGFGLSATEASDLLTAGMQRGLNYTDELGDNLSEYSVRWGEAGMSASEYFSLLEAGTSNGAYNLDKVGDAIKEFSIRAIDGSDSTVEAFTSLGYNAENIMATFATGGEGANKAFFDVINTLMAVDDQVERDALGVALFGTMWEDLGTEAMEAMAGASQAAYDTEGALEKINQVKYNDLDSAIQGIGRQMEVALLPAADAVYQSLMDSMPEITEAMEEVSPVIAEIAGDFADWAGGAISDGLPVLVDGIRDFANWAGKAYEKAKPFLSFLWEHKGTVLAVAAALRVLGPPIGAVTTAMNAFKTAKTFMALLQSSGKIAQVTAAFQRFGSILTGPLGIIIAVAGAIALLYKNWDTVKAWLVNFGNTVNQIWTNFSNMVGNAIAAIGQKFPMLGAYLQGWWESIQAAVDNVKAIFQNIIDFISNVFSGNWSAAWQNIVNIFGNLFGMIVNLAKAPINGVISAINWVISKINSISVTIPDWVPGVGGKTLGFNIPTIPQLAEGGVATSPTLAEIGEGGEPEAVMPLSKLAALLDEYTKKPKPTGGTDGQEGGDGETIVFSPVLNFYGKADREEVEEATRISFEEFKRLYKRLKAEERRKKFKPEPAMG